MRKTKKEIINETYEYYNSDPSRRALENNKTSCTFLTADGRMCAVGRCLTSEALHKAAHHGVYSLVGVKNLFPDQEVFKEEYAGHCNSFWDLIQDFHDLARLWRAERGIEDRRKEYITMLHARWDGTPDGSPGQEGVA